MAGLFHAGINLLSVALVDTNVAELLPSHCRSEMFCVHHVYKCWTSHFLFYQGSGYLEVLVCQKLRCLFGYWVEFMEQNGYTVEHSLPPLPRYSAAWTPIPKKKCIVAVKSLLYQIKMSTKLDNKVFKKWVQKQIEIHDLGTKWDIQLSDNWHQLHTLKNMKCLWTVHLEGTQVLVLQVK